MENHIKKQNLISKNYGSIQRKLLLSALALGLTTATPLMEKNTVQNETVLTYVDSTNRDENSNSIFNELDDAFKEIASVEAQKREKKGLS